LRIAGEGELMESLRELAANSESRMTCSFLGRCDRVADLLFASEIGVLSSKAEGFANAILEYMAAGLPVVATDVGGAREAISEGENWFRCGFDDGQQNGELLSNF